MTPTEQFCNYARVRSNDNVIAARLLYQHELYGHVVAVLRFELETLVKVMFLLNKDLNTRNHLILQTLKNDNRWVLPGAKKPLYETEIFQLADKKLHGWAYSVYKVGCAFIHLSPLVDYKTKNPFDHLTPEQIHDIKQHMYNYHSFNSTDALNMDTVSPYLLKVMEKVANNLDGYILDLERDRLDSL